MRRTRRGALAALAALTLAVGAACSDDDGGGGGGSLRSLGDAIQTVPLDGLEEGAMISWADLDAASEAAGLERPGADELDGLYDWLMALTNDPDSAVSVPLAETFRTQGLQAIEAFEAELGWSIVDASAYIELHHPPRRFFVGSGDLGVDGEGVSELGDGLYTVGEGDDLDQDVRNRTAARPLGRPLRLAERGGLLATSLETPALERWVAGDGERLDDHDGLRAVAAAIDEAEAVSAILLVSSAHLPWAYDVAGIGWSVEDGEPVITIALHLTGSDEDDAASAFEQALAEGSSHTRRPLSELLELEEVVVEEGVLVATVSPGPEGTAHTPFQMLVMQDAPFGVLPQR